jgi:hypothetical protein
MAAKSAEERSEVFRRNFDTQTGVSTTLMKGYDQHRVEAITLRTELLLRLPPDVANRKVPAGLYDHPTNPIGVGMVIDDLERLAKLLTTS